MPQTLTHALRSGVAAAAVLALTACGGDNVSAEELEQMILEMDDTVEVDCEPLEREHGATSECDVEASLIVTATFNEGDNAVDFSSMWGEDSIELEND